MRLLRYLVVVLVISVSVSSYASEDMIGAWLWESTSYPDGAVETPGTMGYSIQLQFSEDWSFLSYRDYVLVEQSTWGVSYVWIEINGGLTHVAFITIESGPQWEPRVVIPFATLELKNADGGTESYRYIGPVASESVSWGNAKAIFWE